MSDEQDFTQDGEEENVEINLEDTDSIEKEEHVSTGKQFSSTNEVSKVISIDTLGSLMDDNFIEYASYVIKDRSIPDVFDGLKPVQRRVLHALSCIDDGRFHKVANVIGQTMQYHPHGDASIGDALVNLANKNLFIDRQGNFGNIFTGDRAAAARYIECRLLPLAKEVLFNKEITSFIESYDGRNQEPVSLPSKIPTVLLLGVMGIAVTLSTNIFSHNFNEVLEAQIAVLKSKDFICFPDFLTGGLIDISNYDDGRGTILSRARIEKVDDKQLIIREIPVGVTTEDLIESIENAYKRGKIKLSSIKDLTSDSVNIEINLPRGVHADEALKQLYAYTDCEVKRSSNLIVLYNNRPRKMTVSEIIYLLTERLVDILGRELEISLLKLTDQYHRKTLARIFIEYRIYKLIEECETEDDVVQAVLSGFVPYRQMLIRDVTEDDVSKLLDLCIRRISKFDMNKNQQELEAILIDLAKNYYNLKNLKDYTINYIKNLKQTYGSLYPRKSEIKVFNAIDIRAIALQNIKVYHDRSTQFVGTSVKPTVKDSEPIVCTEYDRIVTIKTDGTIKVIAISDKCFVGQIKYLYKADKKQIYSMFYREKKTNKWFMKRFQISSYTLDKEYASIPSGCVVEAIYTTYGVVAKLDLQAKKKMELEPVIIDFNEVPLRSIVARGLKVANHQVSRVTLIKRGSEQSIEIAVTVKKSNNSAINENIEEVVEASNEIENTSAYKSRLALARVDHWANVAETAIEPIKDILPEYNHVAKKHIAKNVEEKDKKKSIEKIDKQEVIDAKSTKIIAKKPPVNDVDKQEIIESIPESNKILEKPETIKVVETKTIPENNKIIEKPETIKVVEAKTINTSTSAPRKLIDESEDFFLKG